MNGAGTTKPHRRVVGRIATPALALLLTVTAAAVPARAAAPAPAATATAGANWSRLMQRKLVYENEARRLRVLLPSLRTAVVARDADVKRALAAQVAAVAPVTAATAADDRARTAYTQAKTAAGAAKKSLTTAKKQRPRNAKRVAKAQKALDAATVTVQNRAAVVQKTSAALKGARTAQAAANAQVGTATKAHAKAVAAVATTEERIVSLPKTAAVWGTQAGALSQLVVTQTRASFTLAQTTKVYGITVNKIVASPFQRMLDDAAKAGVKLAGGGFRTKQRQIELRTINGCPDVWTAPASSCRVPTAIPGRSLHEIGLAIDITAGGKTITSRKSKEFKWLAANAGRYGLINLPSEPWHWSITGG